MRHPVAIFAIALALSGVCPATAAVIYESATLQNYGLAIVTEFSGQQFLGTRFQVTGPVHVTSIGGVMYGGGNTFFGAIVPLSGPSGLPSGSPFSAPITASLDSRRESVLRWRCMFRAVCTAAVRTQLCSDPRPE